MERRCRLARHSEEVMGGEAGAWCSSSTRGTRPTLPRRGAVSLVYGGGEALLVVGDSTLVVGDSTLVVGDSTLVVGDSTLVVGDSTLVVGDSMIASVATT